MKSNSQTNLIIDDAVISDLPAITGIYADAVKYGTASFELTPPGKEEMRRRFDKLKSGSFPYLVCRIDSIVAGYAYAGPFHNRPGYKWSVENTVYIDPHFQKQGVGTQLLDQLIQHCTNAKYRQMIAVIGDSANNGSIRLHENAGFHHIGIIKNVGRKHGIWLDSVLMQKALGDGANKAPE